MLQDRYHHRLFSGVRAWGEAHRRIVDLSGDTSPAGLLGLDQMGHFGPQGCDLVAEEIRRMVATADPLRICELGSGFGGPLRYIADVLHRSGVRLSCALALELVIDHCQLASRIESSLPEQRLTPVCADAHLLPMRGLSVDAVIVTGSLPHFADPARVLAEAGRVLRPGGILVLTEEVSLRHQNREVSADFRRLHPPGVFFLSTVEERHAQLAGGGFTEVRFRDLTAWAGELLDARLKALKLFRGSAEGIFGTAEVDEIAKTLEVARDGYLAGTLIPALITARKTAGGAR